MPVEPDNNFSFVKGLRTDGGPFFAEKGYYQDAKNVIHSPDGLIRNRPGIEILNENNIDTITVLTDNTNLFLSSLFFATIVKDNGVKLDAIFLRNGRRLRIYANDGISYTNSLENLNINTPDFDFNLTEVSDEAQYHKTSWSQEGNTVIMTMPNSPIFKVIWSNNTFTVHKVQLTETNENIFKLTGAKSRSKAKAGWYSVDIPLETGVSSYTIDQFFGDAVPGYTPTIYKYDENGLSTKLDSTSYTYSESINTDINYITLSLTYSGGTTKEKLRVYLGQTDLESQDAALSTDQIVIGNTSTDYSTTTATTPRLSLSAFGRLWFAGLIGAIDNTLSSTIPGYGAKYRKIWVSELFPNVLTEPETDTIRCAQARGPFDIFDNVRVPSDGGIIEPDNAARLHAITSYHNYVLVAAANGIWSISGQGEVFNFSQLKLAKLADIRITSSEPMVTTDAGVVVAGERDIYLLALNQQGRGGEPVAIPLVENRIASIYNNIPNEAKEQAFVRYDSYNKRIYYFYPVDTTKNKYRVSGAAQKFLIYDLVTNAWTGNGDISNGDWHILDMVTVPANSYFSSSDSRYKNKQVNLVLLTKKNGGYADITFGIMEGKDYCADYYGTSYKAAFDSYVTTVNSFAAQLGVLNKKQVFRVYVAMRRTEQNDAVNGFYTFPGAVWLKKRVTFADHKYAGPLFSYSYNTSTNTWDTNPKQIYYPAKIGSTVIGGGKPPHEVVVTKLKVAGKGAALALQFGNNYGDTSLTGSIQEQEKPWGVYGYQIEMKRY